MDEYMIDQLLDQLHKGQKIGMQFTSTAYRTVAKEVSRKFGVRCESTHIPNRLKTIKAKFNVAQDILVSGSGFGYNSSTQRIEALSPVWNAYLKAKPDARIYRYGPVKHFEKLSELFGKDRATGSRAAGPKQRQQQWAKEKNRARATISEDDAAISEDVSDLGEEQFLNDTSSSVGAIPSFTTKPPKEPKKRKTRLTDVIENEFSSIKSGLDAVAAALERGNARNYDDRTLYDEVEKVSGISEVSKMKVYQALWRDVDGARAFLACPVERRELWLRVRFGSSLYKDQV